MSSRVGADAGFKPGSTARGGATSGTGRGRDDLGSGGTRGGTRDRERHSSGSGLGKGDSDAVDTLDKLLTELCSDAGLTLIVSLHQVELAREFFPRIVGLKEGKMAFDGSPTDQEIADLYVS